MRKNRSTLRMVVRTAARWWADQLRHGAKLDNGESHPWMMLGKLTQKTELEQISGDQIQAFENKLAELVQECLARTKFVLPRSRLPPRQHPHRSHEGIPAYKDIHLIDTTSVLPEKAVKRR
ncbi:MAG: hypothetical protein UX39_C0001G0057 [Candidatus Magasanikbacteria bacterium GW2011_GWA2_46_17]|uniref:Uncharacterized protein n=1 Tax=Candidatus Magasanikbacteria bacterium GW2011_GWA2_46_17 TaxID=1619042 RepID=A0A0G1P403_9BACT|nr:MAG: hypothetical protein UX39_C0001G0057 [Candidatus Magasanikbacteria bacterium GW2011_GWA2_46_17]